MKSYSPAIVRENNRATVEIWAANVARKDGRSTGKLVEGTERLVQEWDSLDVQDKIDGLTKANGGFFHYFVKGN